MGCEALDAAADEAGAMGTGRAGVVVEEDGWAAARATGGEEVGEGAGGATAAEEE